MNGLGKREVEEARKKYGTNEITALKKDTFFSLFILSCFPLFFELFL